MEKYFHEKIFKKGPFYALLPKLLICLSFFRILGEFHRIAVDAETTADVARKSLGETPSSTSSASVLISIFFLNKTKRFFFHHLFCVIRK